MEKTSKYQSHGGFPFARRGGEGGTCRHPPPRIRKSPSRVRVGKSRRFFAAPYRLPILRGRISPWWTMMFSQMRNGDDSRLRPKRIGPQPLSVQCSRQSIPRPTCMLPQKRFAMSATMLGGKGDGWLLAYWLACWLLVDWWVKGGRLGGLSACRPIGRLASQPAKAQATGAGRLPRPPSNPS